MAENNSKHVTCLIVRKIELELTRKKVVKVRGQKIDENESQ